METTNKKGSVSSVEEIKSGSKEEKKSKERITSKVKDLPDIEFGKGEESKFLKQIQAEYKFATRELDSWVDLNLKRLKLYNNQKRDEKYVGEPLVYVHHSTWLASLYDDEHNKAWIPAEEGDIQMAENLDDLTSFDYDLMGMDEIKYYVYWDALFFSYGLVDMLEFDVDKKCPSPLIVDPLVFYYDTLASSVEGNARSKSGMRFLGWRMYMSERDVGESGLLYDDALDILKREERSEGMTKIDEAREKRIEAMGGTYQHMANTDMNDNNIYEVVQHRTYWKGDRVVVLLTEDLSKIIGAKILPKDEKTGRPLSWFLTAGRFGIQPGQFKGISLLDLLEDKQRKKAVLTNDALMAGRASVYGSTYFYDENRLKNVGDLKWGIDKFIPTDGSPNDVVMPMMKDTPNRQFLNDMLQYLDVSAQTASATPSLQQGVISEEKRTLGELEMVASSSKTRYSLGLKTLAMWERDFWQTYYMSLKVFFKEGIGEKVIRVTGSASPDSFKVLTRGDIICNVDPDVRIESKTLNEASRMREFSQYQGILPLLLQDPEADKRASVKHALELAGKDQDQIDTFLPPTRDELIAREQNKLLSQDKPAKFLVNDNHLVHLREHRKARETKAKRIHMELHVKALMKEQENPELMPQTAGMQQGEVAQVPPATRAQAVEQAPLAEGEVM